MKSNSQQSETNKKKSYIHSIFNPLSASTSYSHHSHTQIQLTFFSSLFFFGYLSHFLLLLLLPAPNICVGFVQFYNAPACIPCAPIYTFGYQINRYFLHFHWIEYSYHTETAQSASCPVSICDVSPLAPLLLRFSVLVRVCVYLVRIFDWVVSFPPSCSIIRCRIFGTVFSSSQTYIKNKILYCRQMLNKIYLVIEPCICKLPRDRREKKLQIGANKLVWQST